jgi:hypothetical protein
VSEVCAKIFIPRKEIVTNMYLLILASEHGNMLRKSISACWKNFVAIV